jgi:hypothetical protein
MPISRIPGVGLETTGTASVNTFLRGDNAWAGTITSGTAVASTSGTSIDFTGIPSTAKRITVMFNGVSTNGTSNMQIQLGTSGGIQTTSYNCAVVYTGTGGAGANATTGFGIFHNNAGDFKSGSATISLLDSNVWTVFGGFTNTGAQPGFVMFASGSKSLGAALDRVRITTVNGTDTFDAGSINIMWEG